VLTVLRGARAGRQLRLSADFATLGRHPSSDLQFDPEGDLDVSGRHTAVFRQGGGFVVRDLGSTNGTWVNGVRIRSDRALESGDRIQLGPRGPEIGFEVVEIDERPAATAAAEPDAPAVPPNTPSRQRAPGQEQSQTDLKIRLEVARQTDKLRRRLFGALFFAAAVVVSLTGWLVWRTTEERLALATERDRILAQVDSLQSVLATTADRASSLRQALDSARQEALQLRQTVATGTVNAAGLAALDSQVAQTITRHTLLLRAARLDVTELTRANGPAVVIVFAEFADGRRVSATGFVARTRGDTGWIVTSRHAVQDAQHLPPAKLGVAFNGSGSTYRARFVAAHDSADVAVLRIVIGRMPRVQGLGSEAPPEVGDPVALVGFPLGLDLPMGGDWRQVGLKASTITGTVSRILPDLVQIDGYGTAGASGSPVFGATGRVIAVLSGGEKESNGRIVYAVPVRAAVEVLDRVTPEKE
jgi:S1-C subfamily serine protease